METANIYLESSQGLDPFHNALLNMAPTPDLQALFTRDDLFDVHRNRLLYVLGQIGRVRALNRSPLFVFAYLEAPHPPFVFGRNGKPYQKGNRYRHIDGNWPIKPGVDADGLRPDLSPVNTFRVVFNAYFGQQYELLPDRSYYSTARQPFRFYDVTADVLAGKSGPPMARE